MVDPVTANVQANLGAIIRDRPRLTDFATYLARDRSGQSPGGAVPSTAAPAEPMAAPSPLEPLVDRALATLPGLEAALGVFVQQGIGLSARADFAAVLREALFDPAAARLVGLAAMPDPPPALCDFAPDSLSLDGVALTIGNAQPRPGLRFAGITFWRAGAGGLDLDGRPVPGYAGLAAEIPNLQLDLQLDGGAGAAAPLILQLLGADDPRRRDAADEVRADDGYLPEVETALAQAGDLRRHWQAVLRAAAGRQAPRLTAGKLAVVMLRDTVVTPSETRIRFDLRAELAETPPNAGASGAAGYGVSA